MKIIAMRALNLLVIGSSVTLANEVFFDPEALPDLGLMNLPGSIVLFIVQPFVVPESCKAHGKCPELDRILDPTLFGIYWIANSLIWGLILRKVLGPGVAALLTQWQGKRDHK